MKLIGMLSQEYYNPMNKSPKASINVEIYARLTNTLGKFYFLCVVMTLLGGCSMSNDISQLNGPTKANALVVNFGKHVGIDNAILDENYDRSFGEFGFHYDSDKNVLIGRVYITKADLNEATPEETESIYRVMKALNDPKVGGMFENGGGFLY